jgi:spore maturation protein CgeB
MPYAFNTKSNSLVIKEDDPLISRIVFIGTPYGSRVNQINFLLKNSIPITIYANKISNLSINNFKTFNFIDFIKLLTFNVGRKIIWAKLLQLFNRNSSLNFLSPYLEIKNDVSFNSLNNIYSKYKLCLAFSEARNTGVLKKPVDIINLRSFEIPGSGGIQIIRYTDELNRFFKNYKNIVMFKNKEELLRLSKLFLFEKTIQELNHLRIASFDNIKENHTWEARFKKSFYLLGK